jgi:hypothetical protein
VLDGKTWRWFTVRLFGLSSESRTWAKLRGDRESKIRVTLPAQPGEIAFALRG